MTKIRVDVKEHFPSGIEILSKLEGTRMEIDYWLKERLEEPKRNYVVEDEGKEIHIYWE